MISIASEPLVKPLCLLFVMLGVLAAQSPKARYVVILKDAPAAKAVGKNTLTQRDTIRAQQATLSASMRKLGADTIGGIQVIGNEVFIAAPPESVSRLRALPGVAAIYPDIPLKPTMNRAIDLVNARAAWNLVGGQDNAGAGVRIAIIDSGIDLTHPAFTDPALVRPSGAPDCTRGTGDCTTPNTKVIVARSYMKQVNYYWSWNAAANTPFLDTDPADTRPDDFTIRDHSGHGTAMAAIAAGAPVTSPGGISFRGIAPKAYLGIYKIFGSPGLNEITYASALQSALEDALTDGMKVAVVGVAESAIWLPSDTPNVCATEDSVNGYCDWTVSSIRNAINQGLTIVVSAGNDGDLGSNSSLGSINSPGTIPEVITVGATTNSHIGVQTVRVAGAGVPSSLQAIDAVFGNGPSPVAAFSAPIVDVTTLGNDGLACSALPANSLAGKIAFIQRGTCNRDVKVNNANAAGAVGVILYEDAASGDFLFKMGSLQNTGIPAALIGNTAGAALKNYLKTNANASATLDPAIRLVDTQQFDVVPYFSSQGPSIDGSIKPELVAPGTDLYTAAQTIDPSGPIYSATGYTAVEGTSFSAAIVGGAAALVLQAHSGFSPAQVKSALVNTANVPVSEIGSGNSLVTASIDAVGGGKLDAQKAIQSDLSVTPSTVSFGFLGNQLPSPVTLILKNNATATMNLTLSVERVESDANTQVSLSATTVSLAAGQTTTVRVSLAGSMPKAGNYSGDIKISGAAVAEHVPFQYTVSDLTAFNILPTQGINWLRPVGDESLYLSFRLMDRYGVPVAGVSHQFAPSSSVIVATSVNGQPVTDSIGFAGARVRVGPNPGEQEFTATAGGKTAFFDGRARTRPVISTIFDAASGSTTLVPGSYASIKGQNLAEATQSARTADLAPSLSGVAVSFDIPDAQISLPGKVSYVSPTQINVLVPSELQGRSNVNVKVINYDAGWNDLTSSDPQSRATSKVSLSDYGAGFFQFDPAFAGCQCAAALDELYQYVTKNHPVQRGHVVQLFLNSLGPVQQSGPYLLTTSTPSVTIGNVTAPVAYSGLAPGFQGLYQVNVTIPQNAPTGVQPISLSIGGTTATSNIAVQ